MPHLRDGDEIWLFGFSRGAYTARVLAGFIHMCGLLWPDQLNLCGYALVAYKRSADNDDMQIGKNFRRIAGARRPTIRFVGAWDTVSSVIVPRRDRFYLPSRQTLPYTRENPSVRTFRHAAAIDERRRMFRLNHWKDPQDFRPDPSEKEELIPQDIKQVWFAGVHSDVGGGYPEAQSGLSKFPLLWMIEEARGTPSAPGLRFHDRLVDWLAKGQRPPDGDNAYDYVAPDPAAPLHRSLKGAWWLLEAFPQRTSEREWPKRLGLLGFYLPWAEPRPIPNRPWRGQPANEPFAVHRSVFDRVAARPDYRPVNIPGKVVLEPPGPMPPSAPRPPYRPEGLWARLKRLFVTVPSAAGWLAVGKSLLWLAPLLALLGWWGGFLGWDPRFDGAMLTIALIAFVLPALAEETLFRGILLKPPSVGVTGLGPAVLSAVLFALWHPLQLWVYRAGGFPEPDWAAYGGHWTFLLAAAAVGFACARLTLASRSLWPAVLLHWLVVVAWAALFGGPGGA